MLDTPSWFGNYATFIFPKHQKVVCLQLSNYIFVSHYARTCPSVQWQQFMQTLKPRSPNLGTNGLMNLSVLLQGVIITPLFGTSLMVRVHHSRREREHVNAGWFNVLYQIRWTP